MRTIRSKDGQVIFCISGSKDILFSTYKTEDDRYSVGVENIPLGSYNTQSEANATMNTIFNFMAAPVVDGGAWLDLRAV